jgi:hypothetical protein
MKHTKKAKNKAKKQQKTSRQNKISARSGKPPNQHLEKNGKKKKKKKKKIALIAKDVRTFIPD